MQYFIPQVPLSFIEYGTLLLAKKKTADWRKEWFDLLEEQVESQRNSLVKCQAGTSEIGGINKAAISAPQFSGFLELYYNKEDPQDGKSSGYRSRILSSW